MNIDVANYEKAVLQNLENVATSLQLLETRQLWEHLPQSRLVRARATLRGLSIDYVYAIVVNQDVGYQFIGFASQTEYPAVEAEFRQIHDSVVIGARRPGK